MKPLPISMLMLAALSACNTATKSEPEPAAPREVAVEPAAIKPAAPAAPVAKAEAEPPADLPVPADFEHEAETSITTANYGKELSLLEKEIAADATK